MRRDPSIRPISLAISVGRQYDRNLDYIGRVIVVSLDGAESVYNIPDNRAAETVELIRESVAVALAKYLPKGDL